MIQVARNLYEYRELIGVLAWKKIIVRYKQSFFGLAWAILKPLVLVMVFTLLNAFVGIPTGGIPYPVLAFSALIPWIFFQESASEGVGSIVSNAPLIRKIYFPREVFPLSGVLTKIIEFGINFAILIVVMAYYGMIPAVTSVWIPIILLYTVLASMAIALVGAALNVFYRDVGTMLPILFQLMMYASPVIYPIAVVKKKLLEEHVAGPWSELYFQLYSLNPLAGIIDAFQRAVVYGQAPDFQLIWPGFLLTMIALPASYAAFKRAEHRFADIV